MKPATSYDEIVTRVTAASGAPQVRLTRHPVAELGLDLLRVDVVPQAPAIAHVGLFGGVHGDEPAGVDIGAGIPRKARLGRPPHDCLQHFSPV